MTDRVFNFGAGPAVLPVVVLEQIREHFPSLPGLGISVLEISHRSKAFADILSVAETNVRELAELSADYHVLFLQGGATQQFSMVPMNLLPKQGVADYVITGSWAKKAAEEAKKFGLVRVAATTESENYTRVPGAGELNQSEDAAYLHITSNNTIYGTQWSSMPTTNGVPLIVDASSDIFSRPLDMTGHGLIYAGAQKNLGPAGVTLVIMKDELVGRAPLSLPTLMRYETYVKSRSLHNTPPVFAVYVLSLVTSWIREQGGLATMASRNKRKAAKLYAKIDRTDFYRGTSHPGSRSDMNVTFRLPTSDLDAQFVASAADNGLVGLKGHRSVGGQRASIYNAFPEDGVSALVDFMTEFERTNG